MKPYSDRQYCDNFEVDDYNNNHSLPLPDEVKVDHHTGAPKDFDLSYDYDDDRDSNDLRVYKQPVNRKRCMYYILSALCLSVLFLIIVTISVTLSVDYKKKPSRVNAVVDFLSDDFASRSILMESQSPQYQAAKWISDLDELNLDIPEDNNYENAFRFIQRYALAVIYYSTNGKNWIIPYDFLTEKDECEWNHLFQTEDTDETVSDSLFKTGVRCNEDKEVINLFLPGNNLVGSIPDEISLLQALDKMSLYSNKITGALPSRLQYLTDLSYLSLEDNELEGIISEWIGNIANLTYLALGGNSFTGTLPDTLYNLQYLEQVAFENNNLYGSIAVFNEIPSIRRLYLQSNNFTGQVGYNFLYNCVNLDELDLSDNQFTGQLTNRFFEYSILDLSYNSLNGTIPHRIEEGMPLTYLMLHNNQFSGVVPTQMAYLQSLTHFDVSRNYLVGDLPTVFGAMPMLRYLYLNDNDFNRGRLPRAYAEIKGLHQLALSNTGLTGSLPYWIGGPSFSSSLSMLDLSNNYLSGQIPDALGELEHIKFLLLNRNNFEGTLPSTMSKMHDLQMALLDHNDFEGNSDVLCDVADGPKVLTADCIEGWTATTTSTIQSESSKFICECCTVCCDKEDKECNNNEVLTNEELSWKDGYPLNQVIFSEDILFLPNQEQKGQMNP